MTIHLFEHASVFDGVNEELLDDHHVLVEDNRIREVSDRPITGVEADIIDCRGKTLMPGMIDAHVHVYVADLEGWLTKEGG